MVVSSSSLQGYLCLCTFPLPYNQPWDGSKAPFPTTFHTLALLRHYWTILCILWWKWTAGRVMIHPDFDSDLTLEKAASHFIINRYGCLTQGGCAEMQSTINLSTCHQLWKIISHKEGVLFLYCYFKLKDTSNHILSNIPTFPHIFYFNYYYLLISQVVITLCIWGKSLISICSLLRMVQGDDHKTSFPAFLNDFFFQFQLFYSVI